MRKYNTPHDRAIKAANWAMKTDPACAVAHRRRLAAKEELDTALKDEIAPARAAYEAAKAEWERLTMAVFDQAMAEAGFPQTEAKKVAGAA
jgi:hypothetical protein